MFNNIFCEMNIKKVIHWGEPGGMGNHPNFFLEVNFSIYSDIKVYYWDISAVSTLLCLLLVLDVYLLIFL